MPLTHPTVPYHVQKSRYCKKKTFFGPKKTVAYRSGYRIGAVDASVAPVPCPEIEISQKKFNPNMKIVAYRSGHVVGAVNISDAPVPRPEIEILQKNFLGPKIENGHISFRVPSRCR